MSVEIQARHGQGPYTIEVHDHGAWRKCPGEWVSLSDARRCATDISARGENCRVIGTTHIARSRLVAEMLLGLSTQDLEDRGLVRIGHAVRVAYDEELDRMWVHREPLEAHKPERCATMRGPLRSIRLEFVGHDIWTPTKIKGMRPWVAEVDLAWSDYISRRTGERIVDIVDRRFLDYEVDYALADETGCFGVYLVYMARQGIVYQIFDRARAAGPRRVLVIHDGQCWHDLTPKEACDAQNFTRRQC